MTDTWTKVNKSPLLREGMAMLVRNGQVIWGGPLGSPIEDVVFDAMILAPEDYERFKASAEKARIWSSEPPK